MDPTPEASTHVQLASLQREKELLLQEVAVDIDQLRQKLKFVNDNISILLQNHAQLKEFSTNWTKLKSRNSEQNTSCSNE